jgi:predicted ABC-type ATPase
MSITTDMDYTFTIGDVVEMPRGMTIEEAYHYLNTGEAPEFGAAPNAFLDGTEDTQPDEGLSEGEALSFLAGYPTDLTAGYDPDQPRDAHGQWTDVPGRGSPLADALKDRMKMIEEAIHSSRAESTDQTHTIAPNVWSPERDKLHREIVNAVYERASKVPNEGHAIILGGPPGAGKTSTLRESTNVDVSHYLVISPDDMKEELARRGMIPEIPGYDLSPMERSSLVHAESMRLARMLADRAYRDRKNIIWDTTMSWHSATQSHIKALRSAKYDKIDAIVIDVSEDVRKHRVAERYAAGHRRYENGHGLGGRYVPQVVMHDQYDANGNSFARNVLKNMHSEFDSWAVYDNSRDGVPPVRVDGKGEIS